MRERTPSADDTPVRAPPTPSTPSTPSTEETTSTKSIAEVGALVGHTVGPVASVNSNNNNNKTMVASSHSLEELGVTHPASASGDRGPPETNRTALDKRSRLSNVINNLRKKVPEAQPQQQQQQQQQQQKSDNDGRNSVERNLENLEKYVMTVLNGVIEDEAQKVDENGTHEACGGTDPRKIRVPSSSEPKENEPLPPTKVEASYPADEIKIEGEEWTSVVTASSGNEGTKGKDKNADEALEGAKNIVEEVLRLVEIPVPVDNPKDSSLDAAQTILDEDSAGREESSQVTEDPAKLMDVCRELMSDLLNDINQLIEEESRDPEAPEIQFSGSSPTSLHCSLPLDKVGPILRSCSTENQTSASSSSPQRSPSRPSPPTVRHLCLYCDRKFLSISLRQRHAERVHQVGGGSRRSERNSRRTVQNCQYCSEKSNSDLSEGNDSSEAAFETLDNLDSLFRHMAKSHPDRYYACVQCSTRYATRESLANHSTDVHGGSGLQEKEVIPKERGSPMLTRETAEPKLEDGGSKKDAFVNPGSPEFDSAFYSSVSCNIRENLLHHLDGKLQGNVERAVIPGQDVKPQQNFYETNANQIQFPIDISLTAATPVYTNSKEYSNDGNENSSEYAQKPGKSRIHPRRVSFEKYNFPRKYDGKEPWSCSIKDLSKFDISTQLTLRKKQQMSKSLTKNRICGQIGTNEQMTSGSTGRQSELTDIDVGTTSNGEENHLGDVHDALGTASIPSEDSSPNSPRCSDLNISEGDSKNTVFTPEFANFMGLKRLNVNEANNQPEVVYAELTGEWSRPRIYVCGACADRYVTLKEMEEHKACAHPNVWCSHFEFAGDQRDLYKHLFVPGKDPPIANAEAAISPEKICTKCSKNCNTLAELHRHILECGGDQTWLLGLFGNGKKKCKWRPFGSRSRRRRQRGMKRNIQNSQTPRANTPKERPTNGPRVRPSDRESIQKMLANLPPKRASRKVLREENLARSREAAQTVQTRSRPRMSADVSSSAVQSRNKTVLKNKLLKNAKSFQRNRTRIDNITAAIESVVSRRSEQTTNEAKTEAKRNDDQNIRATKITAKNVLSVLSKKKNVKTKDSTIANIEHPRTRGRPFGRIRVSNRSKGKTSALTLSGKALSKASGRINSTGSKNSHQSAGQNVEKNSKESGGNSEESGEKLPKPNTSKTKRKKFVDPVASLNASIKARQQLRTNDGKFARNPNKGDGDQSSKVMPDRYPRRHGNVAEFVPKSRIKATKDFGKNQVISVKSGSKRMGRTSSDSNKMPTLEPAVPVKNLETGADVDPDKIPRGNELPVLLPAAIGADKKTLRNNTTMARNTDKDAIRENPSANHLDLDEILEKSVIDVAELKNRFKRDTAFQKKLDVDPKRNRGSRGKPISLEVAPPTPVTSSASSSSLFSSSSSSSCSSSSSSPLTRVKERSNSQRILPRRKNLNENDEDRRSSGNRKPIEAADKEDLITRLGLKVYEQKPRRSARTSSLKDHGDEACTSQQELSASKKSREKISDLAEDPEVLKIGRVRRSPRNLAPKNAVKSLVQVTKTKEPITSETLAKEYRYPTSNPENPLHGQLDLEENLEEDPEDDPGEAHSGLPKRSRVLGKRRGRIKAVEGDTADVLRTENEENSESPANSSIEHLQHESSNSNIDSGKENSSETPLALPKPRAIRPRKTKNGRVGRDRAAKRTLGSVIGILTEGVNIPVEVQQSVVLTVQTTTASSENASSESDMRRENEHRYENVLGEEKSMREKKNEDSENPDDLQRLETRCSHSANDTIETKTDPEQPEVCDLVVRSDNSSGKSQADQEMVRLRSSVSHEAPAIEGTLIPVTGNSSSGEKSASVEPSNDIIMDLSRRKPKGKGSFLEKIVSKIAKQKDVLLAEGDVGSLLDNAVEELTNILDEVAPNLTESIENLTVGANETLTGNDIAAGNNDPVENGSMNVSQCTEATVSKVGSETVSLEQVVEVGPTLEENQLIGISASENLIPQTLCDEEILDVEVKNSEDSTTSKKRAFETNTPKKNKRKSVDAEIIFESEDLVTEELCLADIMKLIQNAKTNGEKDSENARPGKRKTANGNEKEILIEQLEHDESDSINGPKNSAAEDRDSKRPKRTFAIKKLLVKDHVSPIDDEQPLLTTEKAGDVITESFKNSEAFQKKINKRKTITDEDTATPDSENDQSPRPNSAENRSAKRRLLLNDHENLEHQASLSILSTFASDRSSKVLTPGKEAVQEPQSRSSKRKSSLASDHVETCIDDNSVNSEIEKYDEDSGSKPKNVKRLTDDGAVLEGNPEIPKTNDTLESSGRQSITKKRKSVTGEVEHEKQSARDDESKMRAVMEEVKKLKSAIPVDVSYATSKRRTSNRVNPFVDEHLDLDSDDLMTSLKAEDPIYPKLKAKIESSQVVERLRPVRIRNSKRKSLAEDHLELFDDDDDESSADPFKVPDISDLHYSRTRRSSKRSLPLCEIETTNRFENQINALEETEILGKQLDAKKSLSKTSADDSVHSGTQIIPNLRKTSTEIIENLGKSLINEHLDLSDEDNEDQITTDLAERSVELNGSIAFTPETNPTPEISADDDQQQQIPKKRGSGNFAVGHTKTGEILIVEKKKKLTKEAARFFCEVCATSFTRKSSLKKHNSSQSHLMQLAKSDKDPQTGALPLEEEDEKDERNQDYWGSEESLEPLEESIKNVSQADHFVLKSEENRVFKNPLTSQISEEEALEEELLDEEICKITENMTHDDFVLTDHISPELPVVSSTEYNKNSNKPPTVESTKKGNTPKLKKRNLAEEHLDLDSPSPQKNQDIKDNLALDFKVSSTLLEIDSSSRQMSSNNADIELLKPNAERQMSVGKTDVHLAEETGSSYPTNTDSIRPESSPETNNVLLSKPLRVPSRVVSIPVIIQRDVLIPSDESSLDRPLAEALQNTSLVSSNSNLHQLDTQEEKSMRLTSTPTEHGLRESSMSLDFKNVAGKLTSSNERSRQLNDAEFKSNDNSMDTRISGDTKMLLDYPEISVNNYTVQPANGQREKSLSIKENEFGEKESRGKRGKRKVLRDIESEKYSDKKHSRKSKSVKPKRKQKITECLGGSDSSEDENSDVDATSESRNKNKIVKSVFGRVFGSEKLEKIEKIQDKVKEVLDDWDSRSEDDARARDNSLSSTAMSLSPGLKRISRSKKRSNRPKTKSKEDEHITEVVTESKSRRSKKRAEERISKAFEEESTSILKGNSYFQDEDEREEDFSIVCTHLPAPDSRESLKIDTAKKVDDNQWAIFSRDGMKCEKSNVKDFSVAKNDVTIVSETENSIIRVPLPPWPLMLPSSPSPLSPGQSSVAHSSVRNRSPTPDRNSQSSEALDSEDDDDLRRRLSPIFIRNTPDTSMDSLNSNEETPGTFSHENKKSLFVVSSPISKHLEEESEVVTIAPNDAVEDNAIDVPCPVILQNTTLPQKPRQAKVLNFDEELFVECCSRLKATSENELRGAKKIEIVHSVGYHKKDSIDTAGFRSIRDRWRDVESQNSLGSLLESVNQLLGEEKYANDEKDYSVKNTTCDLRSENSSRSGSPDLEAHLGASIPPDNLGYEDSLDVAFEHNNKLRDKIQQRMRASENLIANSFNCETPATTHHSYGDHTSHRIHAVPNVSMDESCNTSVAKVVMSFDEQNQMENYASLDSAGFKHKMTSTLGGFLDKLALTSLLHSTAKHDHNGSTPMKVLAELACARAPTMTSNHVKPQIISAVPSKQKEFPARKMRNPIKELFERKKELNDRNQTEKTQTAAVAVAALKELNVQRQRKTTKKSRKRIQEFPLVRKSSYGGMAERKKRKDVSFVKKDEDSIRNDKVKDVYDFDDEESQTEIPTSSVVSFRSKTLPGEPDLASLASKTIVETLENGKQADILGRRLESMIDRKFKEVEKSALKTKGALKAFQNDKSNPKDASEVDAGSDRAKESKESGREITVGPMDDFVQWKQQHCKRNDITKKLKSKKKSKTSKRKSRTAAWYENDSSDEFRTAAKTEDIGVGISKSQRTCSKGKQNLFAELSSTSSESEIENDNNLNCNAKRGSVKRDVIKIIEDELPHNSILEKRNHIHIELEGQKKMRNYSEMKKSESEMSDHPLIIDERRESDDDSCARNTYETAFEMDDLYREDSSDEADAECPGEGARNKNDGENIEDCELIPLEEALNLLDQPKTLEETKRSENGFAKDNENEKEAGTTTNKVLPDYSESPMEKIQEQNELDELPEKLSSNEKPGNPSDNLPLHVFLSRKVQESKKRKQQHLKKLQEEQERILLELQPTRRQRKCAIGKQGLLAEISSSDEESYDGGRKFQDRERSSSLDKPRRQKRESREKRKERYIEKKHEQIIAKEQKAIEEEILRELGKNAPTDMLNKSLDSSLDQVENKTTDKISPKKPKKHRLIGTSDADADSSSKVNIGSESENNGEKSCESPSKQKKQSRIEQKSPKKSSNNRTKKYSECNSKESKDGKERRSSGVKRDSTDEELRTTKSWNKVEEGVGVAIGRRKRAAANQLYYWSSSSDEEEVIEEPLPNVKEEDDRQEQHGWIVGDSHKRMITMLAMEKQLKEKRRRSEDEFEPNKAKNKKHRNSTS